MLSDVQRKLNGKTAKKGKSTKKLHTTSRILTSEEGRAELRRLEAEEREKELQAEAARLKKTEEEKARQRRQAEQEISGVFTGLLKKMKKDELRDVAASLHLSEDGTVSIIIQRIEQHFEENPHLKESNRYKGLFEQQPQRGRKRAADSENAGPQPAQNQRRRVDESSGSPGSPFPQQQTLPFAAVLATALAIV
ncbi:hypothetical protein BV22DRAFT_1135504 [Leucogyrophana mollusca]|uniref:Uncharacterized protein n=1 Tax=Leucogyrophana mollusca TaxID=85980 RepID=A0ACB8AXN5_9AGAM|nr:hypothetical protein BV22DRAFT_1135504 [Leucogyrophana mollusca]